MKWKLIVFGVSMLILGCILGYGFIRLNESLTNANAGSWNEPPTLTKTISNEDDIYSDLQSLGCAIFNISSEPYPSLANEFYVTYEIFRRFSFNTKIVFLRPAQYRILDCYTIFDGIVIYHRYQGS